MLQMTPKKIVYELNKFIIGQEKAKKILAIALINRWRINKLQYDLKITPKNILIIGPTGVGKTEIAKIISKLTYAPFIKVVATKFTDIEYIGKKIDIIIRELIQTSIQIVKKKKKNFNKKAIKLAEKKILEILLNNIKKSFNNYDKLYQIQTLINKYKNLLKKKFLNGDLDEKKIVIKSLKFINRPNNNIYYNKIKIINKKMKIKDALQFLINKKSSKCINIDKIIKIAIKKVEKNGIVFIDEIDNICTHKNNTTDISCERLQINLLPLLEGCNIYTKYGLVQTKNILFIAAGVFNKTTPSYLITELQRRLPIQVKLNSLTKNDFLKILTNSKSSIILQYKALLQIENYNIIFTKDSIERIAEIACYINENNENIGARRLFTILEIVLENIFILSSIGNIVNIIIDSNYVNKQLIYLIPKKNIFNIII